MTLEAEVLVMVTDLELLVMMTVLVLMKVTESSDDNRCIDVLSEVSLLKEMMIAIHPLYYLVCYSVI